MKLISILWETRKMLPVVMLVLLMTANVNGQISAVCTNPTNVAYGLTNTGEIYEINNATAATIRIIKNNMKLKKNIYL